MEGVGARLGRSSTRYGPSSAVFNGPVRKWKKKWVQASSPSPNNASSNQYHSHQTTYRNGSIANVSHSSELLLYKWTPIGGAVDNISAGDDAAATDSAPEEPPRRKFKFVPIAVLDEPREEFIDNEAADKVDEEAKPSDNDPNAVGSVSKHDDLDDTPDINNVPIEEIQASDDSQLARQDLNISTLDLSLGLNARDRDGNSDAKTHQSRDGSGKG